MQVVIDNREQFKHVLPLLALQNTSFLLTPGIRFTLDCSAADTIR
jgi:hypothetical protein